jgi:Sec-independent protein translocase protein TatA
VSEAVVVSFDMNGGMSSRPLYRFSPGMIISIIEECTPELRRLISAKRLEESNKVRSLERVLKELKKAQATLKQSQRDEFDLTDEDSSKEASLSEEDEAESEPEEDKVTQQGSPQPHAQKDSFAFKGSFGGKREIPGISS